MKDLDQIIHDNAVATCPRQENPALLRKDLNFVCRVLNKIAEGDHPGTPQDVAQGALNILAVIHGEVVDPELAQRLSASEVPVGEQTLGLDSSVSG